MKDANTAPKENQRSEKELIEICIGEQCIFFFPIIVSWPTLSDWSWHLGGVLAPRLGVLYVYCAWVKRIANIVGMLIHNPHINKTITTFFFLMNFHVCSVQKVITFMSGNTDWIWERLLYTATAVVFTLHWTCRIKVLQMLRLTWLRMETPEKLL